jgi:hypothetical protein
MKSPSLVHCCGLVLIVCRIFHSSSIDEDVESSSFRTNAIPFLGDDEEADFLEEKKQSVFDLANGGGKWSSTTTTTTTAAAIAITVPILLTSSYANTCEMLKVLTDYYYYYQ